MKEYIFPVYGIITGSILQLIAAFLPDQQVFMASEPMEKMQAIASGLLGWNLQAILFPIAFAMVTIGFGLLIREMKKKAARGLRV